MKFNPDKSTARIRKWLDRDKKNIRTLVIFMKKKNWDSHAIAHVLSGEDLAEFRLEIVRKFKIK